MSIQLRNDEIVQRLIAAVAPDHPNTASGMEDCAAILEDTLDAIFPHRRAHAASQDCGAAHNDDNDTSHRAGATVNVAKQHMMILQTLARTNKPMTARDIVDATPYLQLSSGSSRMKKLEMDGLVVRVGEAARNRTLYQITEKGMEAVRLAGDRVAA